jgi:hypothetical protein
MTGRSSEAVMIRMRLCWGGSLPCCGSRTGGIHQTLLGSDPIGYPSSPVLLDGHNLDTDSCSRHCPLQQFGNRLATRLQACPNDNNHISGLYVGLLISSRISPNLIWSHLPRVVYTCLVRQRRALLRTRLSGPVRTCTICYPSRGFALLRCHPIFRGQSARQSLNLSWCYLTNPV